MANAVEYGIRGRSQKNVVNKHGSSRGAIKHGVQGSSKKPTVEHNITTPQSDFALPHQGRGDE